MRISSIRIENFRNFHRLEIADLPAMSVIVGENNSGKSNLIYALRLVLDSSLVESARQLELHDFWDGLGSARIGSTIAIDIEVAGFDGDIDTMAILADSMVSLTPAVALLSYRFRPKSQPTARPASSLADYEYITFGGGQERARLGRDVRRLAAMRVLPALRDAEADLAQWTRSPLRNLLERLALPMTDLAAIAATIQGAVDGLVSHPSVAALNDLIEQRIAAMVGPAFALPTELGIGSQREEDLVRGIRVLVEQSRAVGRTGLGATNVLFLALLIESLAQQRAADEIATAVLAVEEPEAHLHPHLQRVLLQYLKSTEPAIVITTHSPQLASVTSLDALTLLRSDGAETKAYSARNAGIEPQAMADLNRYLDAVRADFLFARGVCLVEGAAELFVVPAAATSLGLDLDAAGITVCAVHSADFEPFVRLLGSGGLNIPYVVVTDGDCWPNANGVGYSGFRRGVRLLEALGDRAAKAAFEADDHEECRRLLEAASIYVGEDTLEADIAAIAGASILAALEPLGERARERASAEVATVVTQAGRDALMRRIDAMGKGRMAQRLAATMRPEMVPGYLERALMDLMSRCAR